MTRTHHQALVPQTLDAMRYTRPDRPPPQATPSSLPPSLLLNTPTTNTSLSLITNYPTHLELSQSCQQAGEVVGREAGQLGAQGKQQVFPPRLIGGVLAHC